MTTPNPTPALKPCPFCGPKPDAKLSYVKRFDGHGFMVCCNGCDTIGPERGPTTAEAVAAWNERPGEAALLAACQALDAEQRYFEERTEQPDCMPGNTFYSDRFMAIVRQARAAIASVELHPERT